MAPPSAEQWRSPGAGCGTPVALNAQSGFRPMRSRAFGRSAPSGASSSTRARRPTSPTGSPSTTCPTTTLPSPSPTSAGTVSAAAARQPRRPSRILAASRTTYRGQFLRCAQDDGFSIRDESAPDGRRRKDADDRSMEPVDDIPGRASRREQRLQTGTSSTIPTSENVGTSGSCESRDEPVTASARIFPAIAWESRSSRQSPRPARYPRRARSVPARPAVGDVLHVGARPVLIDSAASMRYSWPRCS